MTLGVSLVAAGTERVLESRAFERLTAAQTFVRVGDARLRYLAIGSPGTGPTVVFVNGFAGCLEQWDHVQRAVSAFAPTLAYDRGGFGFSQGSTAYSASAQADELEALLAALAVKTPVVLVGYSSSASLTRVFVSRHRGEVAGLVLAEPYLPELNGIGPHRDGPVRAYVRPLAVQTVTTLLGVRRLGAAFRRWRASAPPSPLEERASEVLVRFPSWWGIDREWWLTTESEREALAAAPLGDIPVTILSSNPWGTGDDGRLLEHMYRTFVDQSPRGSLRTLPSLRHEELLKEPLGYDAVTEAIRDVETRAR